MKTPETDSLRINDHDWAVEQLPWFVNGTMSHDDAQRYECHLRVCKDCRKSVDTERVIAESLQQRPSTSYMPQQSLHALHERIDKHESQKTSTAHVAPRPTRKSVKLTLIAQAAAIAVLAITLLWMAIPPKPTTGFVTLSNPAETATPHLQVVFSSEATAEQINQTLASVNAQIVRGPTEAGLFEIAPVGLPAEDVLSRLRESPHVAFAAWATQ